MARKLDDLIIGLQLRTKALEDGLKTAQSQLKKFASESESSSLASENRKNKAIERAQKDSLKRQQDNIKQSQKAYDELAVVAAAAFYKIVQSVNSGITAYNQSKASLIGLQSIAEGVGVSYSKLQKDLQAYTSDGLIPATQAATAFKNLLSRGYSEDQTVKVMERLKDAASFGRQGSLELGEAVASATEGLKNENSVLVDNAGVTKNVSVMWKEYAQSVGKSVDDLTKSEKIQAEYNGIMTETRFQVGDAAKLSAELAGAQAKNAAAVLQLQQAYGEGLAPTLSIIYNFITPIIQGMADFAKQNPALVASIAAVVTTLLGLITAFTAVGAAVRVIVPALSALGVTLGGLMLNPVVLGLTAVAGAAAYVAVETAKAKKAQEEYNAALERHNKIKSQGISKTEAPQLQEEVEQIEKLIPQFNTLEEKYKNLKQSASDMTPPLTVLDQAEKETGINAQKLAEEFKKLGYNIDIFSNSTGGAADDLNKFKEAIKETQKVTVDEINAEAKSVAQKKVQQLELQALISQYKKAEVGSNDYKEAQKKLADQFPQFSTASGIMVDAIQGVVKAQEDSVTSEWNAVQQKIDVRKKDLESTILTEQAKQDAIWSTIELEYAQNDGAMNKALDNRIQKYFQASDKLKTLKGQLDGLNALANTSIDKITGISPAETYNSTKYEKSVEDTKAYENEALEAHLHYINHKKALDELSLEQELNEYEWAYKAFAQTEDEKMDLEEKMYDVKKQMIERDKKLQEEANANALKSIEQLEKDLANRTSDSNAWIAQKKQLGELTVQEEIAAYNRIIAYHKEYLNKISSDESVSAEDKKRILDEELSTIQENQNKIISLSKDATDKAVNNYITAKQKQYDWEEDTEEKRLNKKLDDLEKQYSDKEDALKAADRNNDLQKLYAEEAKYKDAATKAGQDKLADIRKQIASLNEENTKEALEKEKQQKQQSIQDEIAANKKKYETLRTDLATEQQSMLSESLTFAKQSTQQMDNATLQLSDSLKKIIGTFASDSETLLKQGLANLQKYIPQYQSIMSSLQLNPLTGNSGSVAALPGGTIVNINDSGDKIFNTNEEGIDYTQELAKSVYNQVRGG